MPLPSFPPGAVPGDEVTIDDPEMGEKVTYTLKDNGVWEAEVLYYTIDELDDDYVNTFGDTMSGDLGENATADGTDTYPGTDDSDPLNNINFSGNVRVDSLTALPNISPIELVEVTNSSSGTVFNTGCVITISGGDHFFGSYAYVSKFSTVTNLEGLATRSYQWQRAMTDSTNPDYLTWENTWPEEADWEDIPGETESQYKVDKGDFTGGEMPMQCYYLRCVETITDTRGNVCTVSGTPNQSCALDSPSNYLGPLTKYQNL